MLTENMLKQEMLWKINTQGYKSAFMAGLFAGYRSVLRNGVSWFLPRSDRPLINMVHVSCGISILC